MDCTRNVLCICDDGGSEAVVAALSESDWVVRTWQPGPHQHDVRECRVGIVVIHRPDPEVLDRVTGLLRRNKHLLLTAVTAPGVVDDPLVAEFVTLNCVDYQTLPIDRERLLFALGHAAGMAELAYQTRERSRGTATSTSLVGDSTNMRALRTELHKVASSDAPVLLTGESGTGKELAARMIHEQSARCRRPFVAVNCASLTPTLIQAELFGYEKGAFTGAYQRKIGHLEAAHTGTIFLDEIGDLDRTLQTLLLRFLEEGTVRRVGGLENVELDVRVIAATHLDIEAEIKAGRFRADLFYRLNVLRVHMPALRERPGDPTRLAHAFLDRFVAEARDHRPKGFDPAALRALEEHPWPGNVRELMNRVRRAMVMADGPLITVADLQLHSQDPHSARKQTSLSQARIEAERLMLVASLDNANWRPSKAAELLGVSRATFYRLVARHGLSVEESGTYRVPEVTADSK